MIAMQCPNCGHAVEVHDSQRGKDALCPQCGGIIKADDSGRHARTGALSEPTHGDKLDSPTAADPVAFSAFEQKRPQPPHRQDPPPVFTPGQPASAAEKFAFLRPPQGPNELGWLGHYRVERLLGRGGMGMVFQAVDIKLQRSVALKVMKPEVSKDNEFRQRFLREARATAAIKSDHIVMIHQVDQQDDVPFLAMEFLQGVPLNRWLDDHPKPAVAVILRLAIGITDGLAAAHERQLIHRDIKPANIWVEQPGDRIKILDFGLARGTRDESGLTETGLVLGTPEYMAPEQAEGAKVDERCDLFSLGCVLYQLGGGGQKAFSGSNTMAVLKAVALKEPTPLQDLNPDLPPAYCELVTRLLAKDPAKRPPSARSVLDALRQIAADPAYAAECLPGTPSGTRVMAFKSPGQSSRSLWFVMAGCLLALGAAVFFSRDMLFPRGAAPQGPRPTAQGVAENEIVLGLSAPFSGPSQELGREMEVGITTYLNRVNNQGGVAGRRLRLVSLDDAYDPDKALANVKELDRERRVFAYIGNVGTPTAQKTLPYAMDRQMLFFGAFTGAALLREVPPARYVFNYRASYEEETAAIVRYLLRVRKIKPEEIAVFAQQDGYGDAGFRGVAKELRNHGRDADQIVRVGYERNQLDMDGAVQKLLAAKEVKAVVMVPTYKPAARFIKQVRDARPEMIFTNVSFVGSDALAEELQLHGPKYVEGIIVTQVVPHPESNASLVLQYRNDLKKYHPSARPNFTSLEGYIDAMLLVEGVRRAGDALNTETLVGALESIQKLDIGLGTPLNYSPSIHQASDKVWGTILDKDGRYQILDLEQ